MEDIKIVNKHNATIIKVIGDIEFDDALEVNETISTLVNKGKINLIFNLEKCDYIDSSGLGSLVEALKECQRRNGDLRLCYLNNDFKDVLNMTRTIKYFQIYDNQESALQSFEN